MIDSSKGFKGDLHTRNTTKKSLFRDSVMTYFTTLIRWHFRHKYLRPLGSALGKPIHSVFFLTQHLETIPALSRVWLRLLNTKSALLCKSSLSLLATMPESPSNTLRISQGPNATNTRKDPVKLSIPPLRMARSTKSTKRCGAQTILICDEITYNPPPI